MPYVILRIEMRRKNKINKQQQQKPHFLFQSFFLLNIDIRQTTQNKATTKY